MKLESKNYDLSLYQLYILPTHLIPRTFLSRCSTEAYPSLLPPYWSCALFVRAIMNTMSLYRVGDQTGTPSQPQFGYHDSNGRKTSHLFQITDQLTLGMKDAGSSPQPND